MTHRHIQTITSDLHYARDTAQCTGVRIERRGYNLAGDPIYEVAHDIRVTGWDRAVTTAFELLGAL